MILWAFLIGMVLCALALRLLRTEDGAQMTDKFGSAVTHFAAWSAFGMLLMGGTYGLGIVIPGLVAAAVLVFRNSNMVPTLSGLAPFKMPLGIGALLASVATWIGVLNLMEDIPNA